MIKWLIRLGSVTAMMFLGVPAAHAAPVTISFTGTVTSVDLGLGGAFSTSDVLTGTFASTARHRGFRVAATVRIISHQRSCCPRLLGHIHSPALSTKCCPTNRVPTHTRCGSIEAQGPCSPAPM